MGNKLKKIYYKSKTSNSLIGQISRCPNCQKQFPKNTTYNNFDQHLNNCLEYFKPTDQQRLKMKRKFQNHYLSPNQDFIHIQVFVKKKYGQENNIYDNHLANNNVRQDKVSNNKQIQTRESYVWQKKKLTYSQSQLSQLPLKQILKKETAYKILWVHQKISNLRVTWKQGSSQLVFHPNNIVKDSLKLFYFNLYKQLKITVINDVVHDAGGLLRQWANMLLNQLINGYKLFIRNKQGYYILNPQYSSNNKLCERIMQNKQQSKKQQISLKEQTHQYPLNHKLFQHQHQDIDKYQYQLYQNYYINNIQDYGYGSEVINKDTYYLTNINNITYKDLYKLFARLLAKILIDKVTIPIHFDYIFLNNILKKNCQNYLSTYQQDNIINLLFTYDKEISQSIEYLHKLYNNLVGKEKSQDKYGVFIKELQSLCLTFSVPATLYTYEQQLKKNGRNIGVNNLETLKQYLDLIQKYYLKNQYRNQIQIIKKQFYGIIKQQYFDNVFQCDQFELVINGIDGDNINVKDWQDGTQYRQPYNASHRVIKYFWNVVNKMNAQQKTKLLKFVTGSQRLPIFGFKNLQTNRGQTSHFAIEGIKYDKKKMSFPKAYTCFNRLILPIYPNEETLQEGLMAIVRNNLEGIWGMQ